MKNIAKLAVVIAAIAVVAVAPAQRMMMGGGGMSSPAMTLFSGGMRETTIRDDVSRELKLTNEQKDKLLEAAQKQREEMMASFTGGGGERPDMAVIQKMMAEMQTKSEKTVKEILTPEQSKRLRELYIQRSGNNALLNIDVQKELKFTDAQTAKVKVLQTKQGEAMAGIMERMRNGEVQRDEMRPLMEKNNKILGEELLKILTAEQATQFRAMSGVAFKFDEDNGGN